MTWVGRGLKSVVFMLCLLPLCYGLGAFWQHQLGPNPIEALIHLSGDWALRLLWITLAMTPLRQLTGWRWPLTLRRMFGLFCFSYAAIHVMLYWIFDRALEWSEILKDITKRPFVTVGFLAFVILLPLAATSSDWAIKKLGRRWKSLHRWVYGAAVLVAVHFWWKQKADIREPAVYALILLVLLGYRVWHAKRRIKQIA
jgi:methionine sulfoxide reductase heme-binding subunit